MYVYPEVVVYTPEVIKYIYMETPCYITVFGGLYVEV